VDRKALIGPLRSFTIQSVSNDDPSSVDSVSGILAPPTYSSDRFVAIAAKLVDVATPSDTGNTFKPEPAAPPKRKRFPDKTKESVLRVLSSDQVRILLTSPMVYAHPATHIRIDPIYGRPSVDTITPELPLPNPARVCFGDTASSRYYARLTSESNKVKVDPDDVLWATIPSADGVDSGASIVGNKRGRIVALSPPVAGTELKLGACPVGARSQASCATISAKTSTYRYIALQPWVLADLTGASRTALDDSAINATIVCANQVWNQVCVNFYPALAAPRWNGPGPVPGSTWTHTVAILRATPDLLTNPGDGTDAAAAAITKAIQKLDPSRDYVAAFFRMKLLPAVDYGAADQAGAVLFQAPRPLQATAADEFEDSAVPLPLACTTLAHEIGHVLGLNAIDLLSSTLRYGPIDPPYLGAHSFQPNSLMYPTGPPGGGPYDLTDSEAIHALVRSTDEP
jgi:hypothetical protein